MNFRELIQHLEDRIGYHQIPINPAATGPKDWFEGCPLHHELMTEVIRAIYKQNGCRKLTDPVDRKKTFKALSPIRLKVLHAANTDIDVFHLVENLCAAIDQVFAEGEQLTAGRRRRRPTDQPASKAEVVDLDNFRFRRFRSLA
ncbi:MAG: hypothetical protein ACE5K1_04015 [Acidiferrobacterales bacterium]